jgi:hypothetical protein
MYYYCVSRTMNQEVENQLSSLGATIENSIKNDTDTGTEAYMAVDNSGISAPTNTLDVSITEIPNAVGVRGIDGAPGIAGGPGMDGTAGGPGTAGCPGVKVDITTVSGTKPDATA